MALWDKIGAWSFIVGLVIAILAGFGLTATWVAWFLAFLGLLVGILNVGDKEVTKFLLAAIAFMLFANSLGSVFSGMEFLGAILENIKIFVAPAAGIVSLKAIYDIAKEK